MNPLSFGSLQDPATTLLHLQCSAEIVFDILQHPERHYEQLIIPKKGKKGDHRLVYRLSNSLRRIQRIIAIGLQAKVALLSENVQGFRLDRSIVSNARIHCGYKTIVTADIANFFDAIGIEHVRQIFSNLGSADSVALMLARLCIFKGVLPQGGRTSPALANLAALPLDSAIIEAWPKANYTRYADDLAFSGEELPSETALKTLLQKFNFDLKKGSYKRQERSAGQYVTGLNVLNESPCVPRRVRREIEKDLYYCKKFGIAAHLRRRSGLDPDRLDITNFRISLHGRIVSWGRVDAKQKEDWISQFEELADSHGTGSPE